MTTKTPPSLRDDLLAIPARASSRPPSPPEAREAKGHTLSLAPTRSYLASIPWLDTPNLERGLPTRLFLTKAGRYRVR